MQNYRIDRKLMKQDARNAMREHRPSLFLIAFVFLVITYVLGLLQTRLDFPGMTIDQIYQFTYGDVIVNSAIEKIMESRTAGSRFLSFATQIMSIMLSGGFTLMGGEHGEK